MGSHVDGRGIAILGAGKSMINPDMMKRVYLNSGTRFQAPWTTMLL